jgi:hypothetical protein
VVVVKRAFVVLAALGVAACTALLGIDKDYRVSASEAGLDATACPTCDGGPLPDGNIDDGGGAEASSPCAQMHSFCDDFDKNPLGIGWTGTYAGAYAKLGIENTAFVSPPNGLSCETPNSKDAANDPASEAKLVRMVLGKFNQLTVDVDIRIDAASSDPNLTTELVGVAMVSQNNNPNWHVVLHHYSTRLQVVEEHFGYPDGGYDYLYNDLPQSFVIGQWTHVRMEVAPSGAKTHARVFIGGQKVFDQDLVEVWGKDTKAEVQIGTYSMWWGADHWKVRYDNLAFDAQ